MSTFILSFYYIEGSVNLTRSIRITHLYSEPSQFIWLNKENYLKSIKGLEFFYHRMGWDVLFKMSGHPGHFGMPSEVLKT